MALSYGGEKILKQMHEYEQTQERKIKGERAIPLNDFNK